MDSLLLKKTKKNYLWNLTIFIRHIIYDNSAVAVECPNNQKVVMDENGQVLPYANVSIK
jgi:hypothetical protein